jgi:hypothetical protein
MCIFYKMITIQIGNLIVIAFEDAMVFCLYTFEWWISRDVMGLKLCWVWTYPKLLQQKFTIRNVSQYIIVLKVLKGWCLEQSPLHYSKRICMSNFRWLFTPSFCKYQFAYTFGADLPLGWTLVLGKENDCCYLTNHVYWSHIDCYWLVRYNNWSTCGHVDASSMYHVQHL